MKMRLDIEDLGKKVITQDYAVQAQAAMGIFGPWMDVADHMIGILYDVIEEAFKGKITSSMLGKTALEHIWKTIQSHVHKHDNTVLIDGMEDILSLQLDVILDFDSITLFIYVVPVLDNDLGIFEVFQLVQAVLPRPDNTELNLTSQQQVLFLDRTQPDRYKTLSLEETEKCRIVGQKFYACQKNNGELRVDIVRMNNS